MQAGRRYRQLGTSRRSEPERVCNALGFPEAADHDRPVGVKTGSTGSPSAGGPIAAADATTMLARKQWTFRSALPSRAWRQDGIEACGLRRLALKVRIAQAFVVVEVDDPKAIAGLDDQFYGRC